MAQCYWKSKVNCTFLAVHGTLCTGVVEVRWIPACLQFSWVFTQRNWRKLLLSKSLRTEGCSSPSTTSFSVMTTSKKGLWISGCFFFQVRHCAELLADCMFTFCEAGFSYWAESLLTTPGPNSDNIYRVFPLQRQPETSFPPTWENSPLIKAVLQANLARKRRWQACWNSHSFHWS